MGKERGVSEVWLLLSCLLSRGRVSAGVRGQMGERHVLDEPVIQRSQRICCGEGCSFIGAGIGFCSSMSPPFVDTEKTAVP